ncbi:MAG: Tad domain-containing protein [Asticcacaulis sp.]
MMFLRTLKSHIGGNVAMMVALTIPVILMLVGGALDFSRMVALRIEMQDAADVASLGAVAVNSKAYKIGQTMGSGEIKEGSTQALSIYQANIRPHAELKNTTVSAKVMKTGTVLNSTVTTTGLYKPYILGLFGFNNLPVNATAKSIATLPPYIDFYLLLDNTPSMGLGATYDDITKMINATANVSNTNERRCAFACHETEGNAGKDYYTLARSKAVNATLRIDVVREATQDLMTTAQTTRTQDNQYRMAIYDFGADAKTVPQADPPAYKVSDLTTDLAKSSDDAKNKIALMTVPYQNYKMDQQTNFNSVLSYMNNSVIGNPGNGMSTVTPQKVLFFVSDGMSDGYTCDKNGTNCKRKLGGLDPAYCQAIKDRGIRIAVLYTTYLRLVGAYAPTDSWYKNNVDKYIAPTNQVTANMQACASPGLFFEVAPDKGISEAMTALFYRVLTVVRIDQ